MILFLGALLFFSPQGEKETMIIKSYSDLKDFSTFQSVEAMNVSIKVFKQEHSYELNQSDLALLDLLSQYSCKYRGVSWLKNETIIEAMEKSESTIERAKRKLKKLGILKVIRTVKRSGGNGANLYIIQPFKSDREDYSHSNDNMDDKVHNADKTLRINSNEGKSYLKASIQANYKRVRNKEMKIDDLDYTFTPSHIPMQFIDTVRPFFSEAKSIYFYWNKVRQAYNMSKLDQPVEYYLDTIIRAFKESIFVTKRGNIKKSFNGYLFGTLRGMFAVAKRREVFEEGYGYDWLKI